MSIAPDPDDDGEVIEIVEMRSRRIDEIAREALTWIERLEADAVAFGIVEASTRGSEVVAHFRGRVVDQVACTESDVLQVLRALWVANQLIVLAGDPRGDPGEWVFRSRMGELVRLLSHLKQRFA